MSETRYVRKNDYYGGDIWLELDNPDPDWGDPIVEVCWLAWGKYGSASLTLTVAEARTLAAELLAVTDGLDEQ